MPIGLYDAWLAGKIVFGQTLEEAQVIVSYAGLRFVLARQSCTNNEAPLDLITAMPPQNDSTHASGLTPVLRASEDWL
jgi:hypothetical protein